MKHLQNQTNNRQKSDGLRQALNREVNIPQGDGAGQFAFRRRGER